MEITGYGALFADDVTGFLVDGWDDAVGPVFWATHLLRQGYDEDVVLAGFGIEAEVARRHHARLRRSDRWPVYRIPLSGGRSLAVVYRNYPGDRGVDYLLEVPGRDAVRLACVDGDFTGPGISWSELTAIADAPSPGGTPSARLLLLWPMSGDIAMPRIAAPVAARAVGELGAVGTVGELAELLADDHPMWDFPA